MRYAFLCYDNEAVIGGWTKEYDAKVIAGHHAVQKPYLEDGRLTKSLRLMPSTTATTVRPAAGDETFVIDGPFAETKEQLLGFWLLDCETLDDAVEFAKKLTANKPSGSIEIRPVMNDFEIGNTA